VWYNILTVTSGAAIAIAVNGAVIPGTTYFLGSGAITGVNLSGYCQIRTTVVNSILHLRAIGPPFPSLIVPAVAGVPTATIMITRVR
jgi:hypothetical protein